MNIVNLEQLKESLNRLVSSKALPMVEVRHKCGIGIEVRIDGEHCLTSIGIWPNGCCDVDYLYVESEQGNFYHFEFQSQEEAVTVVSKEIQLAVERSNQGPANNSFKADSKPLRGSERP